MGVSTNVPEYSTTTCDYHDALFFQQPEQLIRPLLTLHSRLRWDLGNIQQFENSNAPHHRGRVPDQGYCCCRWHFQQHSCHHSHCNPPLPTPPGILNREESSATYHLMRRPPHYYRFLLEQLKPEARTHHCPRREPNCSCQLRLHRRRRRINQKTPHHPLHCRSLRLDPPGTELSRHRLSPARFQDNAGASGRVTLRMSKMVPEG